MSFKKPIDETVFENIDTEEKAYWIGFLMADGCVHKAKNGQHLISVQLQGRDRAHLEKYRVFLKTGCKLQESIRKGKPYNTVSVSSKKIFNDLAKYGITPRKSLTADLFLLENNKHTWRGLVDGDGCLCYRKNGKPEIGLCGSLEVVGKFSKFCHNTLGLPETPPRRVSTIWQVNYYGSKACAVSDLLYKDSSVYLDRKYTLYKEWASRKEEYCANPRAKLTEKNVLEILESDSSYKTLAEKYECSIPNIEHVKLGQTWKKLHAEFHAKNKPTT